MGIVPFAYTLTRQEKDCSEVKFSLSWRWILPKKNFLPKLWRATVMWCCYHRVKNMLGN